MNFGAALSEVFFNGEWIKNVRCSPILLVARVPHFLVMTGAKRYGEFVEDLALKRIRPGEGQVMGMHAVLTANCARMAGDELEVLGITQFFGSPSVGAGLSMMA